MRHNFFLAFKEALNNVVKHARCKHIRFQLRVTDSHLSLTMTDDGRGFAREMATATAGNGLQNMEKRMDKIGGCFDIQSEPGKGTRIRLEIPLNR